MDTLRQSFSDYDDETYDKAKAAAARRVKAIVPKKFALASGGSFNAVALPVVPAEVTSVTDASKAQLEYRVCGQQVIAERPFVAPVAVEYTTFNQRTKWNIAMIEAIWKELKKQ